MPEDKLANKRLDNKLEAWQKNTQYDFVSDSPVTTTLQASHHFATRDNACSPARLPALPKDLWDQLNSLFRLVIFLPPFVRLHN